MAISLTPVLRTPRLILRETRLEDFEPTARMWADDTVVWYVGRQPSSRHDSWMRTIRMPGLWALLGYGYWSVEERETGRFVGHAGLADFKRDLEPDIEGVPEAGYAFTPESHGRGYATEAMQAVMQWADANLDAPRTCALINAENTASLRVADKLGFGEAQTALLNGAPVQLLWRSKPE